MSASPAAPDAAAEAARAERYVRRGELLTALEIYDRLLDQAPDDLQLIARKEAIGALLQPSELLRARAQPGAEEEAPPDEALTLEMEGERLANAGQFAEAAQMYERASLLRPGNDLLRERLDELRRLAPPKATARAAVAGLPPSAPDAPPGTRGDGALPEDPAERLKALLERISRNRRT